MTTNSTEQHANLLLTKGRGVVIRDTQGIGEPLLGRVVQITENYVMVAVEGDRLVRFELATGCAMLPGQHERWKLTAPDTPSSEEYNDLLIRQARLQAQHDRINRELDFVVAALGTADDVSIEPLMTLDGFAYEEQV